MPAEDLSTGESPNSPQRYGAAEIAMELRRSIQEGLYVHGERLPAERHLAEQFGTSRGTARHALNQLEKMNLVTRRVGSGTFVNSVDIATANDIAEATSPLELVDVRFAIEPQMTRLAVLNASSRDLRNLRAALERVEALSDPEAFSEADEAFHLVLAECSGNPLIVWLYRQINEVRGHTQWGQMKEKILSPERIALYNEQHQRLYQAIVSRDAAAAIHTMKMHLSTAREDLLGAQEEPPTPGH